MTARASPTSREEAGCSVGAVYFRFKDKGALFSAIARILHRGCARSASAALLSRTPAKPPSRSSAVRLGVRRELSAPPGPFPRHRRARHRASAGDEARSSVSATSLRPRWRTRSTAARKAASDISVRVMTQMVYGFLHRRACSTNGRPPASTTHAPLPNWRTHASPIWRAERRRS